MYKTDGELFLATWKSAHVLLLHFCKLKLKMEFIISEKFVFLEEPNSYSK